MATIREPSPDEPIPWWKTRLGDDEIEAVAAAIRDRRINQGPLTQELEARLAERLDVPYAVYTTSGTAALWLALKACGVGTGDEVIVPATSFIATAHAVLMCGARVRLCDVEADRPVLDIGQIEAAITDRTKAILPVHLGGRACDIGAIHDIASHRGLKIIEDTAQALASQRGGRCLGTRGDAGAFSFGVTKLITTGEGGLAVTRDADIHERMCKLRNQGVMSIEKNVFDEFGFNLRSTDMMAAIGLVQARKIEAHVAAVRRVYDFYRTQLQGIAYLSILDVDLEAGELPLWTEVLCSDRENVVERLRLRNIVAKPYHPSLVESKQLGASGSFPRAERFARYGLILPSGPDQSEEDLQRVVDVLREIAHMSKHHHEQTERSEFRATVNNGGTGLLVVGASGEIEL